MTTKEYGKMLRFILFLKVVAKEPTRGKTLKTRKMDKAETSMKVNKHKHMLSGLLLLIQF